jgi:hypothetical protein
MMRQKERDVFLLGCCMLCHCRVGKMVQERGIHSKELHDSQFSSNIITMVVYKMGGACGTNRTGGKCITNFSGKSEGLTPPANVKMVNVYYRNMIGGCEWIILA